MTTQTYYFSGEARFAHLYKADTTFGEPGNWHISVILDDPSKEVYAASGMQVRPKGLKKDASAPPAVKFSRPTQKVIKDELVKFERPEVVHPDGSKVEGLLGNGSKVTVKVLVFDTMRGKGHRLEKVQVNEFIEYKPEPKADAAVAAPTNAPKGVVPF